MRRVLMWIAWNIPLGRLAPYCWEWLLGQKGGRLTMKIMCKILFPLKCIAAVLLSPLLLAAVGALLVMRYEDQLLD